MSNRNLYGDGNTGDSISILGFPIQQAPPPVNGNILQYQNGEWDLVAVSSSGLNTITNIGAGQGIFASITGSNADLKSIANTDSNISVTSNASTVNLALANTVNVATQINCPKISTDEIALKTLTYVKLPRIFLSSAVLDNAGGAGGVGKYLSTNGTTTLWQNLIDDTVTTSSNIWSASKVQSQITAVSSTIYTSDGIVSMPAGGTRTVALPSSGGGSASKLNVLGGYLQNNFVGITQPNGLYSTLCNSAVVADSNGLLQGYGLTNTFNSVRFDVDMSQMTNLANSLDIYEFNSTADMVFNAEIYLSSNQTGNEVAYKWIVQAAGTVPIGVWNYVPPERTNFVTAFGGNDYTLEYLFVLPNQMKIRLRLLRYVLTPGALGQMTIICRDVETATQGKYSLITPQIAYNDTSFIGNIDNGNPQKDLTNINGTGVPPSMMFTIYGQKFIKISFSVCTRSTSTGSLIANIIVNGNNIGAVLSNKAEPAEDCYLNATDIIGSYTIYGLSLGILNYGTNTLALDFSTSTGFFNFTDKFYTITVEQS